ncbi:hypothetical protein Tco_0654703 [Tanacetum coccineum]|uniref:Uncharacterized protein n=1 Tax=Tanacetum coccineum TaxID=301880 RepID=A0ABQ4X431_9ASTR
MILFNCLAWNLRKIEDDEIIRQDIRRSLYGRFSFYDPRSGYHKKTENQAKMTKLSMEWKRLCKINAKVRVNTEESAVKPEPELKNTIECNLNPSDGPGKPNSIIMKTVKTKWALNQLQQPICVQLTKTVKTLKAQS